MIHSLDEDTCRVRFRHRIRAKAKERNIYVLYADAEKACSGLFYVCIWLTFAHTSLH